MNDLPALYAAVCAKRPELAVMSIGAPGVRMYYDAESFGWYWDDPAPKHIGDRFAAALILARWVEAMPAWFKLSKQDNSDHDDAINGVMWWVEDFIHYKHEGYAPTPIEALAAYYLGQ